MSTKKHCETCICEDTVAIFNPDFVNTADQHCRTCTCGLSFLETVKAYAKDYRGRNMGQISVWLIEQKMIPRFLSFSRAECQEKLKDHSKPTMCFLYHYLRMKLLEDP